MRLPSPARRLVPLAAVLALAAPGGALAQPDEGGRAATTPSTAVHDEHFPPVASSGGVAHDEHFPPVAGTTSTTVGATDDGGDGVLSVETAAAGAVGATLAALAALGLVTVRRRPRATA